MGANIKKGVKKNILVVDDSALMRRAICDIINESDAYEATDTCRDGLEAYEKIKNGSYAAVLLDINMPRMNGLELLQKLQKENIRATVIIVSSLAKEDAKITIQAMEYGAIDFMTKPENIIEAKGAQFRQNLTNLLNSVLPQSRLPRPPRASGAPSPASAPAPSASGTASAASAPSSPASAAASAVTAASAARAAASASAARAATAASAASAAPSAASASAASAATAARAAATATSAAASSAASAVSSQPAARKAVHRKPTGGNNKLVAIASSTGGPKALQSVIPFLEKKIDAPIVLVQHMPAGFTKSMAERLNELSKVEVREAEENDVLKKGCVYIAPGGCHLEIAALKGGGHKIHLSDAPPIGGLRPCANVMYRSLKRSSFDQIICVVLTGMGADGADGIRELNRAKPIYVIAQDEPSCVVYGMPKAVAEAGLTDEVVPLANVPKRILNQVGEG